MTLEEFLTLTTRRLPTASELIGICDDLGITFGQATDGKPTVKHPGGLKDEAVALVAILKREPWRTQVLVAKGLKEPPPCKVFLWRDGHLYRQPPEEDGQFPAGAWWWRCSNETAWQVVPGREEWAAGHSPPEVAGA